MGRERLTTPDEELAEEFGRVMHLFTQAISHPTEKARFQMLMNEASSKGLNWVDALEYVASQRRSVC